jgi:hypothetical protein
MVLINARLRSVGSVRIVSRVENQRPTNIRSSTPAQAESALRRFVVDALRGELKITYPTERIGPDSESGHSAVKFAAVGWSGSSL